MFTVLNSNSNIPSPSFDRNTDLAIETNLDITEPNRNQSFEKTSISDSINLLISKAFELFFWVGKSGFSEGKGRQFVPNFLTSHKAAGASEWIRVEGVV